MDIIMIPFSIVWCGFAIFWEITVFSKGAPFFFLLFGIIFIALGVYIVVGRFFTDGLARKKTLYGITDERVIIWSGIFRSELKSLQLGTISNISLVEKPGGEGTITLGPSSPWIRYSVSFAWPGHGYGSPMFEQISDAKHVFGILRDARKLA